MIKIEKTSSYQFFSLLFEFHSDNFARILKSICVFIQCYVSILHMFRAGKLIIQNFGFHQRR